MEWKNLDEIQIVCKRCGMTMILESTLNDTNAILSCSNCGERVNLKVNR